MSLTLIDVVFDMGGVITFENQETPFFVLILLYPIFGYFASLAADNCGIGYVRLCANLYEYFLLRTAMCSRGVSKAIQSALKTAFKIH